MSNDLVIAKGEHKTALPRWKEIVAKYQQQQHRKLLGFRALKHAFAPASAPNGR